MRLQEVRTGRKYRVLRWIDDVMLVADRQPATMEKAQLLFGNYKPPYGFCKSLIGEANRIRRGTFVP